MYSIQGKEEGLEEVGTTIAVKTYSWIHLLTTTVNPMLLKLGGGHVMRLSLIPSCHMSGRKSKRKSQILHSYYSSNQGLSQFSYTKELMHQESFKMKKVRNKIRIPLNSLDLSLNTMAKSKINTVKIKIRENRLINFCQWFPICKN